MKLAIEIPKFGLAAMGVGLGIYHNVLFAQLASRGSARSDAVHSVQLNDHGVFSYITPDQSMALNHVGYAAGLFFVAAVVLDLIQRRRAK
jgi:hypothetical protein